MNDLPHLFEENIQNQNLFRTDHLLLLAVSGGVDSVVLCELCYLAGFQFDVVHCNFQLRGEESERDERFVQSLARRYGVEVFIQRFETETHALQHKTSIQVAARILRYQWFDELAAALESKKNKPVYILTAHHADDNIETVLMNFFKGTGIAGMRGMLPITGRIVRPLLFAHKKALIDFAMERGLSFVEDSSNASNKYSRNYVRNQIVPLIEEKYPGAKDNISASLERFREIELLYMQAVAMHKKKLMEQRGNEIHIAVRKLLKLNPLKTIVFEITKGYGFTAKQAEEVGALLESETGKFVLSGTHRILRNRNWLIISPLPQNASSVIVINEGERELGFERGQLTLNMREIKEGEAKILDTPSVGCVDSKDIRFPLLLRKWKSGDYFYPLGMRKKKKLSRFFIDRKMSLAEKENTWVIEMDKKIIWVVNQRIDDRFKILPGTKKMLRMELKPIEI